MNTEICKYALLGGKLGHSYSPLIHKKLGLPNYELLETVKENLECMLQNQQYKGFNVTIPFKCDVIELCDKVSDEAKEIGSVNTVVRNNDGSLSAYNTDIDGFIYAAVSAGINFKDKKVLILGSGGTSLTVQAASKKLGATRITVVSRKGEVTYENLNAYLDSDIIINTTPVGMYPNNLDILFNLELFTNCTGVMDVIYNPRRTSLIMAAEKREIPFVDGLPMLVYQAKRAEELFLGKSIPDNEAERVIREIRAESGNIILVGMPGSGKSAIGELIAKISGRKFVNVDTEIEKNVGKAIPEIFTENGEPTFREYEREETEKAGKLTGAVIATGGGVVKDIRNYAPLHQNGRIYYIRRELSALETDGRPLSKNLETLIQLQKEREHLYCDFADKVIQNNLALEEAARRIMEDYNENIGH